MNATRALLAALLLAAACGSLWLLSQERASGEVAHAESPAAAPESRPEADLAEVRRSGEDGKPAEAPPARRESAPTETEVEVEDTPATATLVVRFVDVATGEAIANQRCFARPIDELTVQVRTVDRAEGALGDAPRSEAEGEVRLTVPPGSYFVTRTGDFQETLEVHDLAAGEVREVVFELVTEVDGSFHVLAVDSETGHGLADVELRLVGVPEVGGKLPEVTWTGPDGRAVLAYPTWRDVGGTAHAEGYGPLHFSVGTGRETPDRALRLPLRRGATLRGAVVDGAGGPVSGAEVRVTAETWQVRADGEQLMFSGAHAKPEQWIATSGVDGRFELVDLAPGADLEVVVRLDGRDVVKETEPLRLSPGEVREATYRLYAGTRVSGVLLGPDGAPVPDDEVWLLAGDEPRMFIAWEEPYASADTDAEGRFSLGDVQPGAWLVGAAPSRMAEESTLTPWPTAVQVPEGAPAIEIVVRVPVGLFVGGRTVGPEGEPVPDVFLFASGEDSYANAASDSEGVFLIGPLGAGEVTLHPTAAGGGYAGGGTVRAQAGDRDVLVHLVRGGVVSGRALDARDHEPVVAEITIAAAPEDNPLGSTTISRTHDDGTFRFTGRAPGLYSVVARTDGGLVGMAGRVVVEPGLETEVELLVQAGARVRILLPEDSEATTYRVLQAGRVLELDGVRSGSNATTRPFPPGEVTIELRGPDGLLGERTVTALEGEVVEVRF